MSTPAASSTEGFLTRDDIKQACASIGRTLGGYRYAVVGGAACQLLGSPRLTEDVDLVVEKDAIRNARKLLAADKQQFHVDPRTLYTHHKSENPVRIDVLAPPGTFKEPFDGDTPTMTITVGDGSVTILHPVLILNAKCRSILGRHADDKKISDAQDIEYLLEYLASVGTFPTPSQVPNISQDFIKYFIDLHGRGGEEPWKKVKLL